MNRLDYAKEKPEFIARLRAITHEQEQFRLDSKLRALVELRVSQINGCVYCVDLHSREARTLGENQQRLDSLPVWKESPCFDLREKAALAWVESLTLIPQSHACDADYRAVCESFSSTEVVELSLAVSLANFWNRMAGGFRRMPEKSNPRSAIVEQNRVIDHIDLRVSHLDEAKSFYDRLMPVIGFPHSYASSLGIAYEAESIHSKPEFVGLIEDPDHQPCATRIAFRASNNATVDGIVEIATLAGAHNVEGPLFCPEYSPTYYAVFFDDPSGNHLEVCCRTAP